MRWSITVREVMSRDVVAVDVTATPSVLQDLLQGSAFHHLPVLEGKTLVGMVSAIDLARVSLSAWVEDAETAGAWLDSKFRIRDLMTWEPEFVRDADTIRVAADKLSSGSFHALPVLDHKDALVGIVTSTDLVRVLAQG